MCSGSAKKVWIVAAGVGVVEALKDQGQCKWNNSLISGQQQHAKCHVGSLSQRKKKIPSSCMVKGKKSEESLRTIMYLSCWVPN
ncbi:hypothetical protein Lal_00034091 [Lupinus albus]|uniref:Uncharacterized protein n=1 Tax=Lupinus albus TaxID=3870 RepID=A0A6A5PGG8_LUPAL|nr:hypothetical protein Lalb_Chr03g0029121 [Lupinus albus]KAF1896393.1 hypothetical protein Lal_00034091 [Lupinus albus]